MVANRWPTARNQPADALYKPSSTEEEGVGERVIKKQRRERRKKPETQRYQLHFLVFLEPHTENELPLTNTGLKLRKQKRTERELGELEKQSTGTIFQTKAEETEGRKAEVDGEILAY
jgi:hypothetical protein